MGFHIFTKIKNTQTADYSKKIFQLLHFRNSQFFLYAIFQRIINVWSEHSFNRNKPKNVPNLYLLFFYEIDKMADGLTNVFIP